MKSTTRRHFLRQSSVAATAAVGLPGIARAHFLGKNPIVGTGEHTYEVIHNCVQLPDKYTWQTTHNVTVDKDQNLYVMHEGNKTLTDHPSIFVFDHEGKFMRAFGSQFQGGGHGVEIRTEGSEQFLYVTAYQQVKSFAKMTLDGKTVWEKRAPMESKRYAKDEDKSKEATWGRDRFMPTNVAFHPTDGSFYLADGYGAHCIHRYDKDANYLSTFGKPGKGDGEFNLPHGLWIDTRGGRAPQICVTDRSNGRLQWFDLEGKHLKTMEEPFILPANIDILGDTLLVPDLAARITLLDKDDKMIHLGEDPAWLEEVLKDNKKFRSSPDRWIKEAEGRFIHPHDACFDAAGNIFVAEWVATGRITKLRKV